MKRLRAHSETGSRTGNVRFGTPGNRHGSINEFHFIPLCLRSLYKAFLVCVIGAFMEQILAQGRESAKYQSKALDLPVSRRFRIIM
jgi:hypothetical protein